MSILWHIQSFTPLKFRIGIKETFKDSLVTNAIVYLLFYYFLFFYPKDLGVSHIKQEILLCLLYERVDFLHPQLLWKRWMDFTETFVDSEVINAIVHLLIIFALKGFLEVFIKQSISVIYLVVLGMHLRPLQKDMKW